MADVILVNPISEGIQTNPSLYNKINFREPTNLLCLGSYLEHKGYSVKIVDAWPHHILGDDYLSTLKTELKDAKVLGLTVMTPQIEDALKLSALSKEVNPNIFTVWGGAHPTLFPGQTCKDPVVDFVVFGEGEETLFELVEHLERNSNDFNKIDGLAYKKNGKVKVNKPRKLLDMDKLPYPNWKLVEIEHYLELSDGTKELQIHSSRGCPHRCGFCINYLVGRRKWRAKSPERVLEEIRLLVDEYGVDSIRFRDENFVVNKKRVDAIADGLIKEKVNIQWRMNSRADYFRKGFISKEDLTKWKKSGLQQIDIGAESGSDRILKLIKKDLNVEQIINAAEIINGFDLRSTFSFMCGLPSETKYDMNKTVELIMKIKKINPEFALIGPQIFRPYPGGELYDIAKQSGFKEPESLRGWIALDSLNATGYSSLDQLRWIQDKKYVYFLSQNMGYLVNSLYDLITKRSKNLPQSSKHSIYGLIQKIRWKTKFFYLPYEKVIFQRLTKAFR